MVNRILLFLFFLIINLTYLLNHVYSQELVDLNKASKEELIKLPGIGEAIAQKIIELREKKGGFKRVEDLLEVKGIGEKKLKRIKPFVKIGEIEINSQSSSNSSVKSIYRYVDEHGVIHFTQFPETVPSKYRRSLRELR